MQKAVPNDEELVQKKRARRRLVGAVALVLMMIILLPMILKDRTASEPAEEVVITLSNENKKTEAIPMQSDFDSNVVSAETDTINSDDPTDSSISAEQSESATEVPTAKPTTQLESNIKKSSNSPQYYVQIGVFSDAANVKKLQAKLSDLGYSSQTEKIDTVKGEKIRLRTPLLGDRNEAAAALQTIKDAGLTGMVVSQ